MGRRVSPQVRTCLVRGLLQQQRHPLGSPATASTGHVPRRFVSSANNGAAVKNRASALTPASRSSSLALVPFVPFALVRWKNEQCYSLTPASAYSSSSSSGSAGVVVVESAEDFENALNKREHCPQFSTFLPRGVVPEGIQNKLSELGISAVPTLNFYKDGKIAAKVVGADVQKIKGIMEQFYK
ncbi:hypothetical protein Taro_043699 [Colocasia esculenta]|uniref:Uncharacterized protein n=1 Tax=Colocasia esculenta TaxID=4460 RepID=A0A843WH47_COLES|nr:hypothetical protein [Colocasia esculenta]